MYGNSIMNFYDIFPGYVWVICAFFGACVKMYLKILELQKILFDSLMTRFAIYLEDNFKILQKYEKKLRKKGKKIANYHDLTIYYWQLRQKVSIVLNKAVSQNQIGPFSDPNDSVVSLNVDELIPLVNKDKMHLLTLSFKARDATLVLGDGFTKEFLSLYEEKTYRFFKLGT